ncbi:MAG TPA: hypothetical protein VN833_35045, partial [Candidatus Acidoferrales bacterium]|nr:hypothetical protein [Candidatus Acidoferrales bacterium]
MSWLGTLWRTSREILALPARWWHHLGRRKLKPYRYVHVEEFPDALDANKLYIAGEHGYFWAAAMLCPCGCGDVIELNLL